MKAGRTSRYLCASWSGNVVDNQCAAVLAPHEHRLPAYGGYDEVLVNPDWECIIRCRYLCSGGSLQNLANGLDLEADKPALIGLANCQRQSVAVNVAGSQ